MPSPREHPIAYLKENGVFPHGPYLQDAPKEVFLAAGLAVRLQTKIGNESIRYIAKKADLSPQTLLNILKGVSWPDLRTIARLENALDTKLWGNEHRRYYRYLHFWWGLYPNQQPP